MRMSRVALVIAVVLFGAGAAQAHHGYAAFFLPTERTAEVEGVVERVNYANPHVQLWLRTTDGKLVTITWGSLQQLAVNNWPGVDQAVRADTVKRGDRLVVVGAAPRDPDRGEIARVQEVRRPRDGWIWRNPSRYTNPD